MTNGSDTMPSPIVKEAFGYGTFYKRKGGAYKFSKKHNTFVYVGSGNGTYSMRNLKQDRQRKAKKNAKLRKRYPHEYD